MIDILHDLAWCSMYLALIAITIGIIALVAACVYYCIHEVKYRTKNANK